MILGLGGTFGENLGLVTGFGIHYQQKKNLYSFRYIYNPQYSYDVAVVAFTAFPIISVKNSLEEYAAMYCIRKINDGHSFSFSAGVSYNSFTSRLRDENNASYTTVEEYIGFPFEVNVKWFKKEKKRFKIYHVIPVGKPTAVGGSFGFKLVGNISKNSFIGVGIVYGLGMHKVY